MAAQGDLGRTLTPGRWREIERLFGDRDPVAQRRHVGALVETPVSWAEVYAGAETLSAAHTGKTGTRGLDVLHVASAAAVGAGTFYTFDARQKALAVKAGLKVHP